MHRPKPPRLFPVALISLGLMAGAAYSDISGVGADSIPGGLFYQWYWGGWDKMPDFGQQTPAGFGVAAGVDLSVVPATQNFGVRYEGYIDVAAAGEYSFYTNSDDGSLLYVDDLPVVNNDGLHGLQTRWGSVVLAPGHHAFRVDFFQRGGGQGLSVGYSDPNGVTQSIPVASLSYDTSRLPSPREPDVPSGAIYAGLAYGYYQGAWSQLPAFDTLQPVFLGVSGGFDITDRQVSDNFAFRHQGFVVVPQDGLYTFYLASDDGSALYIGNQKVIDNDGLHAMQERSGSILLKAGMHRITTGFFDATGSEVLTVQWAGPGYGKAPIPPEALLHTMDMLPPLMPADTPAGPLLPRLAYRYFEGSWSVLPDFTTLPPRALGLANRFDLSPSPATYTFGLSFKGYIQVPQDGVYRFYTTSDDGSRLWIGNQLVVNNDGSHGAVRAYGSIGLAAGAHAIRVDYMQGWGGSQLLVEYRTPDGKLQTVPAEALFHTADQLPPLLDAVPTPANLQDGLAYAYTEGYFSSVSPMQAAVPRSHGVVDHFSIAPRGRDDGFGFVYDGYLYAPEDGYYRFSSESDDGSRLWIDSNLVVDNDGLHGDKTVYGSLGLKAGWHQIRAAFIEYNNNQILSIGWQTPSGTAVEIPASALRHTSAQLPTLLASSALPATTKPGMGYRYYEGSWSSLPNFANLAPVGLGALSNFSLETAAQPYTYAFRFDGYVQIPADGFYDFYTNSDDGSRLWIDDVLAVDNDGSHPARDAVGNLGLAAGWHRIRVGYVQGYGPATLNVAWKAPGGQRVPIPDAALVFDPASMPGLQGPAAARDALLSGIQYAYYEWNPSQSAWTALPDLGSLTPLSTGVQEGFSLAPRLHDDRFAFRFTGYVDIPEYGYYTFYTTSDDGSRLYIDNQLVVNNDGLHPLMERAGRVGLERGRHAITVDFFDWTGDQVLTVSYAGPHFGKMPLSPSVLFRLDPARAGNAGDPGQPEGPTLPSANHPPLAGQDQITTGIGAGQGVTANVIANDSDPDGDIPMLVGVKPANGYGTALADSATGKLVYYPPLGFVGQDQLVYTVSDRRGGLAQGQVTVQAGAGVTTQMSPAEASRFLTQASFGPTKAGIAEVMQKGAEAWIDEQLALPPTLHATALDAMRKVGETPSLRELRVRAWLDHAVNAPDQLRQRVAFALSEILVVSDQGNVLGTDMGAPGAADYYDVLVREAFGNYRQLLGEVTLHPAMGLFLNMAGNKKADPTLGTVADENYAREIMQLFTVGLWKLGPDGQRLLDANGQPIPSYDEGKVMELAKVFTGWNFAAASGVDRYRLPLVLDDSLHDSGTKTLLDGWVMPTGQGGVADLHQALDHLAIHPNLPPFIARELIQRLVTSNPSPAYVGRVAAAFAGSGLNVGAAVKAILLDPEARAAPAPAATADGKIREPLLQLTALWRGLGVNPAALLLRLDQLAPLGQTPLSAPSVFNFFKPDYQSPSLAKFGLYTPELEPLNEKQVMGAANLIDDWTLGGRGYYDLNMELAYAHASADKAVSHFDLLFLAGRMTPAMRQVLMNAMFDGTGLGDGYSDADRLTRMLGAAYLILTSPEFQTQR